ncbi:hypothetical protein A5668_01425 [Mycolicibacterium fortuitum]|nr:hypothetical protein A5668_01425 [Mycolicibacterium fortuitum]
MAKHESLDQLTAAVAQAELIPEGRPLTTEEILGLDGLAARLRRQFSSDRSVEITSLLRRVSGVRTGKRVAVVPVVPVPPPSPVAGRGKRKRQGKNRVAKIRKLAVKLNRISAAGSPMSEPDAQALNGIVDQLRVLADTDNRAMSLWLRARDTRDYLNGKPSGPGRDRSGVPLAGLIGAPRGLDNAKREVSGGLPGTRRGH